MVHGRSGAAFAEEPPARIGIAGRILHELHRALLVRDRVLGGPHDAHATLSQSALELITCTDQRSRNQIIHGDLTPVTVTR